MHLGPHTCNSLSQIEYMYIAACTCDTPPGTDENKYTYTYVTHFGGVYEHV